MGKLDELLRSGASNMAESIGAGRGLGNSPLVTSSAPARWQGVTKSRNAVEIPVEKLHRDENQPREEFDPDALVRLAESLRTRGQLQPIRVRWDDGSGGYVIIAGERRWRAARMAGLATVSAVVVEGEMAPGELLAVQLVENCLREDLNAVEQARAFLALIERNGWSIRQLAAGLDLDHSAVAKTIKLAGLPEAVQGLVERGELPTWTAFEVAKAETPELQEEVARLAVAEGLTATETAAAVRERSAAKGKGRGVGRGKVRSRVFRKAAGCTVTVECARGVDADGIRAALAEVLARLDAEQPPAPGG